MCGKPVGKAGAIDTESLPPEIKDKIYRPGEDIEIELELDEHAKQHREELEKFIKEARGNKI